VSRTFCPRRKYDIVYRDFILSLPKWERISVDEDLRACKEFRQKLLDIRCRRKTRPPTTTDIKKQTIGAIKTSTLQCNVHGCKRFLANQIVQYDTWGRIMRAIQKLLLLGKAIKFIESLNEAC
jgi:hypothetical protein